jgi:hypothetical protein
MSAGHLMYRWSKCRTKGRRLTYTEEQLLLKSLPGMTRPVDLYRNSPAEALFDADGRPKTSKP